MTEAEFNLTERNLERWTAFVAKVECKAKAADRELTDDEKDNIEMRNAQCIVWRHQLKEAVKKGFSGADAKGSMSVNASAKTGESAVASE